jgi:hypothetical protein
VLLPYLDPDAPGACAWGRQIFMLAASNVSLISALLATPWKHSSMGEMESLRLQMAMDRMSKMMSTLSNLLKKISDTANAMTQNLK